MLRSFSKADLATALAGLNPIQKAELLTLLEARAEAAPPEIIDTRPSLESLLEEIRQEQAAASVDPEAWLKAEAKFNERRDWHRERLRAKSEPDHRTLEEFLMGSCDDLREASELARADGYLPADEVVPKRAADQDRPASGSPKTDPTWPELPAAVRRERPTARPAQPDNVIRYVSSVPGDPLADFRGSGQSEPPSWVDGV